MGSGTSRGKKVAPACVSEVNAAKAASPKRDGGRAFEPLQIHALLRTARNAGAQPDRHSEGNDSDLSREEEEDADQELDTVLADYEERGRASAKRDPPKKTAVRSKTYGLCHLRREEDEDSTPRGSRGVNKRSDEAFTHFQKHTPACPSQHSVRDCITLMFDHYCYWIRRD